MLVSQELRLNYLRWMAQADITEAQEVNKRRRYYDGDHTVFLTDRQKEFINLDQRGEGYSDNYCKQIVDILAERLSISSVTADGEDQTIANLVWSWWLDNRFYSLENELYIAALRDSEAYIIVSYDQDLGRPTWAINLKNSGENGVVTSGIKLHRHPDNNEPVFASKRWESWNPFDPGSGTRQMRALYFDDRVEIYTTPSRYVDRLWREAGWMPFIEIDQETGQDKPWPIWWTSDGTETGEPLGLPVIPFSNPEGSEISTSIISMQDALNKTELDLIATADAHGFPILWSAGANPKSSIKIAPGRLIRMPKDTTLNRIPSENPTALLETASFFQQSIGSKSRIPLYLLQRWGGTPPTGESLKQQEQGLISKAEKRQKDFGDSWRQVFELSLRLEKAFGSNDLPDERIRVTPHWSLPYARSINEMKEEAAAKSEAGVPDEQILIEVWGYSPVQAREFIEKQETRANQVIAETVLGMFEGGQNGNGNGATQPSNVTA